MELEACRTPILVVGISSAPSTISRDLSRTQGCSDSVSSFKHLIPRGAGDPVSREGLPVLWARALPSSLPVASPDSSELIAARDDGGSGEHVLWGD